MLSNNRKREETSPPPELTILSYRDDITDAIRKHPVTIIVGPTGCGKTTQVPQFILDDCAIRRERANILVSQPRKIAAITLANRVANERNTELGTVIGYQVGLQTKMNNEQEGSRVLFCTTGVILQKLIMEKSMVKFTHIILDEIHEREIDMDLLLVITKEFLLYNSISTKLILMSASVNPEKFVKYLTLKSACNFIVPSVIYLSSSNKYNIMKYYLDDLRSFKFNEEEIINYGVPQIVPEMYKLAAKIIMQRFRESNPKKQQSILVFLPGIYEIEALNSILQNLKEISDNCLICVLHSLMSTADQRIAFKLSMKPKIILATNIAESSVTIMGPEVGCVIDFCLTKNLTTSRGSSMPTLKMEWTSRNSCLQRAGRTGRTCDGEVYRLVSSHFYEREMQNESVPEMERIPLETVILRVKKLDISSPISFLSKSLSPPEVGSVVNAIMVLKELGGLERITAENEFHIGDGKLTWIGRIMTALPLDVHLTKLIVMGYVFSMLDEAIIIAAGLNIRSIFRCNFRNKIGDFSHKMSWADGSGSDEIALLNAYNYWRFMSAQGHFKNWQIEEEWCTRYNLERKNLHEMRELIREIEGRLKELKMESLTGSMKVTWQEKERPFILKICIAATFISNYYMQREQTETSIHDIYKTVCGFDPYRTVYLKNMKRDIVGEVYEDTIKKTLIEKGICRDMEDMKVVFDKNSSKIFINFIKNESMVDTECYDIRNAENRYGRPSVAGKISPEVYKSIKLRKLEPNFVLNVMDVEATMNYAIEHGIAEIKRGVFHCTNTFLKRPDLCVLPTLHMDRMTGIITHIEHYGKFFFQPTSHGFEGILDQVHSMLDECNLIKIQTVQHLRCGQLVIARHNNLPKRAKIISKIARIRQAECYMFDYGYTVDIVADQIYQVTSEIIECFEISERCFECSMSKITPSFLKCPRGKWTVESIKEFNQIARNREATVEIYSVVHDVVSVKLFIEGENINNLLIEKGFAMESDEIYVNKMDHDMRLQAKTTSTAPNDHAEIEFVGKKNTIITTNCPSPSSEDCNVTLNLSGPHSPLETRITSIRCSGTSSVIIDPQSVNCIILDDDFDNINGRLIVAANVSKSRSGNITLHETTIMPNIPGLTVLLGMMFAPDVIFRRNNACTRYESFQFGLGADPKTGKPYYREHDCIIPVNIQLQADDFHDINLLRCTMSYLLMTQKHETESTLSDEDKHHLLKLMKEQVIKILGKNRSMVETTGVLSVDGKTNSWETEDQSDAIVREEIFPGGGHYHSIICPEIYPTSDIEKAKLQKLLKEVENATLTSSPGRFSLGSALKCPICNRTFEDIPSLRIHFLSAMHQQRKKDIGIKH